MFGQNAGMRLPTEVRRYYEGPLWSTFFFRKGEALDNRNYPLFTTCIGNCGQGKPNNAPLDAVDTNMMENGRVASGLAHTVYEVTWDVWAEDPADCRALVYGGALRWCFLNNEIPICPLLCEGAFSEGGAAPSAPQDERTALADELEAAANDPEWNNLTPSQRKGLPDRLRELARLIEKAKRLVGHADPSNQANCYHGAHQYRELPVLLPANTTFSVRVHFGTSVQPLRGPAQLRVSLHGVTTSAVPQV